MGNTMNKKNLALLDSAARLDALTKLDQSFLVEAGAGSGKTSLLAGRVVGLLASGIKPEKIVSVSFTELAASELLGRIMDFATAMVNGEVPVDLKQAYPHGLSPDQLSNLKTSLDSLGEMTCTTIHGFCQKLVRPFPVEADIDPGASILDPSEADLIFEDVLRKWMRQKMSGTDMQADIVASLVAFDPKQAVEAIEEVAKCLRQNPEIRPHEVDEAFEYITKLKQAVQSLVTWSGNQAAIPADHALFVEAWSRMVKAIADIDSSEPHVMAVALATLSVDECIAVKAGGYKKYRLKTAWKALDKKGGEALNDQAVELYEKCCSAFDDLRKAAAARGLHLLTASVHGAVDEYQEFKRDSAMLDFDDLLFKARELLRRHPQVLESLQKTYTHILVDEFQDTDTIQAEIFRLLAFDLIEGDWVPRGGSIFFVGDPKQSIYRFRGADVAAYIYMRELMRKANPSSVMSIFVNFRSSEGIIDYVNAVFEGPLSSDNQPGFTALASFRGAGTSAAVMKYEASSEGSMEDKRKLEAERLADTVKHLTETYKVKQKDGSERPCRPSEH
jgi:exodeoxyribonuclease-5